LIHLIQLRDRGYLKTTTRGRNKNFVHVKSSMYNRNGQGKSGKEYCGVTRGEKIDIGHVTNVEVKIATETQRSNVEYPTKSATDTVLSQIPSIIFS